MRLCVGLSCLAGLIKLEEIGLDHGTYQAQPDSAVNPQIAPTHRLTISGTLPAGKVPLMA
ncbi:hypothetical protein [Croceibacterium mercuriale]|uniref:hypothetical protein n=1 Tax=Croceibacterium mercuriale TaxID=1572751 RepID=UPI0013793A04|nr:hypothetical protein [Croceibacterium mercuriale]